MLLKKKQKKKNIWHSEGLQLEDCVWTNRAKMRAPTTSQQLAWVCFCMGECEQEAEVCLCAIWSGVQAYCGTDGWRMLYFLLSVYLNSIFNTNILKEMKQLAADL